MCKKSWFITFFLEIISTYLWPSVSPQHPTYRSTFPHVDRLTKGSVCFFIYSITSFFISVFISVFFLLYPSFFRITSCIFMTHCSTRVCPWSLSDARLGGSLAGCLSLARFNKTSFDLGFALCLFIALLLLGPGLVTYVMSRGSSYLYLAGNANIKEERFP